MPIDGSLEDKLNHTVKTYGTAALSSTRSATGTTSAFITIAAAKVDYIEVQNVKNFINEDFIVEFWAYSSNRPYLFQGIFNVNGVANKLYVSVGTDGTYYLFKPTTSIWDVYSESTAPKMPLNTWVHVKIERKENILRLYQNDQLVVKHPNPITAIITGESVTVGIATSNKVTNNYDATIYVSANTTYDFTPNTNIFIESPISITYNNNLVNCVHGFAVSGKCECNEGYTGSDCSLSMCGWKKGQHSGTPTPTTESTIVNSEAIQFSVQVNQHPTIPFEHYLTIGDSSFNIPTCTIVGESIALTSLSSTDCTKHYLSDSVTIDLLINNVQVQKELMGDYIKLTVPLLPILQGDAREAEFHLEEGTFPTST